MAPTRIILIRHAEKPSGSNGTQGISLDGNADPQSLSPLGWQRAGALARLFCPMAPDSPLRPSVVFAAGVGHGSQSRRPIETVTPLVALLKETAPTLFITDHLKRDRQALLDDALSRDGVVLISWEHKGLPALVGLVPHEPAASKIWPNHRFDMIWILDRLHTGWRFSQKPQLLLAGDLADPI